jgi:predicted molibdopterin-dependent oxidoreductase YjgC
MGMMRVIVDENLVDTEFADVVLPAATFAEKDGTFTNTERRVQRVRRAIEPLGNARPDWWIFCKLANKIGAPGFDFSHPSEIFEEISALTPIYGGISYERLKQNGGLQWPCPTREHGGTPILHTTRFATSDGKGKFMPLSYKLSAELPDDTYPLILTTGRSLYQFHTATMTRKIGGLSVFKGYEELEINVS